MTETPKIKILCHILEDDDAIVMVLKDQLEMNEVPYEIFNNDQDFIKAFHENVHICVIDFSPSKATAMNGVQITNVVIEKSPDCRVIMITGRDESSTKCKNMQEFFHAGGFRWLNKDEEVFEYKFTRYVQEAIHFFKVRLHQKKVSQENAGHVVRQRQKLSVENEKLD